MPLTRNARADGSFKKFPCNCGGEFRQVIDSRTKKDGTVRRVRSCTSCNARTITREVVEGDGNKPWEKAAGGETIRVAKIIRFQKQT